MPTSNSLPFSITKLQECVAASIHSSPASIALNRQPTIEGDDHMIFLIENNLDYIVRVTKPREDGSRCYNGQEMQARDIALRKFIQDEYRARSLDDTVIPRSIGTWSLSDDENFVASLETRLQGSGLHRTPASELTVQGLETFLSVLKYVNVKELQEILGQTIPSIPFPNLNFLRHSAIEAWKRLLERGQLSAKEFGEQGPIIRMLEKKTAMPERLQQLPSEFSPALVHNDIKGEHILVDPHSGRITGILDWADAGIGNAAVDIAGLALTVGSDLARKIAWRVGYGENQILQGILQARCECVLRLDDRLNGDDRISPVDLLRNQLLLSLED